MTADELLEKYQDKLDVYWRNAICSRNEPGELATLVKCIFIEGYNAATRERRCHTKSRHCATGSS